MKLKAPKTWQLIVILITVFVLAIGGSLLAVYLTTGFEASVIPPKEIEVEDLSATYNASNSQYETGTSFKLKITSATEGVTEREITLGFKSGVSVTRSEGKISDKTIIVPERVRLNEEFDVELVQATYTSKSGEIFTSNKGGISELVILTQNNQLGSTTIKIAVDVPVREIGLELVDATTGAVLGDESAASRIAEGTHFAVRPKFYPEESRYLFSDNINSAITSKREKDVFYEVASSSQGVGFEFNDFDPYFVAADQTSENNQINAYAFSSAKEQLLFYASNLQIEGQPLYSEAIRQLTLPSANAASSKILVNVVEANVGEFKVDTTTAENPIEFVTNRLLRISARTSSLADRNLNINISDIHGQSLFAMIKNVGLRVVKVTDSRENEVNNNLVTIKGGETISANGNEYVLINSQVKNLSHAYWEISTNGEYLIQVEVVLLVEDEKGQTQIFVPEGQAYEAKYVYLKSAEGQDNPVDWTNGVGNQLSIMLIYDAQGNPIVSELSKELSSLTDVPKDNIYQKTVFFVYYDAAFGEGESMSDFVDVDSVGQGIYNIPGIGSKPLYPLRGSSLVAKDALNFNLIFATIRTDAYGNPIMEGNKTYTVQKWSRAVSVQVEKTLQGLDDYFLNINNNFLTEQNFFAIPTQTESGLNLVLKLKKGDQSIFQQEYANRRIAFYAAEDSKGEIRNNDIFNFDEPQYGEDGVTVTIPFSVRNVKIEEVRGKDFWVRIDYNNSITTNSWCAEPKSADGKDFVGALKIYNQNPASISNETLAGKIFDINNRLKSDGSSDITVSGNGLTTDLATFNSYIRNTIVKDAYGREFEKGIVLSSDNTSAVTVINETTSIFPLNAKAKNVTITVKASEDVGYTFTLNVDSVGVTEIKVKGVSQGTSPRAEIAGEPAKPANPIFLKKSKDHSDGFLEVFVQGALGNETYASDKYSIQISPTFLASVGKNSMLWKMLKINGEQIEPSSETQVESLEILKNFGQTVTIPFVAKNESETLNFVFNLTISATAKLTNNNLNGIEYKDNLKGVRESDKPEGATSEQIFVYAEYGIDLNRYFTAENVKWAEAYNGTGHELKVSGKTIGYISDGVLTFKDVYQLTTYNIHLYAIRENKDGVISENNYGFNQEIVVTVVPNFDITANANTPLQLSDLYTGTSPDILQYVTLERIAGDKALPTFDYIIEDESTLDSTNRPLQYVKVAASKVLFNSTLNLNYGEESRTNKLSLLFEGTTVKTCDIQISVGTTQESLSACGNWLNNFVNYGEKRMLIISESSLDFAQHIFANNLKVELLSNPNAYSLAGNGTSRRVNFEFKGEPVKVGENYYLAIGFTNSSTTVATIKVPIIISAVGNKFASAFDGENEDIKLVLDGATKLEVKGGTSYELVAPATIDGKEYTFINLGEGIKLALISEETITADKEGENLKITVGGTDYPYSIVDGRINSFGSSVGLNIGEGGVLNIAGEKYLVSAINNELITINRLEISEGHTFVTADGAFGTVLKELDGTKYLTGFKEGEVDVRFEVANAYKNMLAVNGTTLTISHIIGSGEQDQVEARFRIIQNGNGMSKTYEFVLSILPDAEIQEPVYPFNGNTELLEVANGETKTVGMKDQLGADTLNNGKVRFPDKLIIGEEEQDIEGNLGLVIKEVKIGEEKVGAINGRFDVRIDGQNVIFENKAGVSDVSVTVQRTYEGIFLGYENGKEREYLYNFSINSSGEQSYFVEFSGQSAGNLNDNTWALANSTAEQTLTVTTFWKSETGQGEVGRDVITTATNDFGDGFAFEFNNKQLSITIPDFVAEETTKHVYFSVNGIKIGELNVVIPATVDAEFKLSEFDANTSIEANDILSLSENYEIKEVKIVGNVDNFASVSGTSLTIGHLVEDKKLTLKFNYENTTDAEKKGSAEKTFDVRANLIFKDLIAITEDVTAGESLVVTTSQYLDNVILSLKGFSVEAVRKAGFNFDAIKTASINDKGAVTIETNFVSEAQTAQFFLRFTYTFNGKQGFTQEVEVHLPIKPAVTMKVNYPAPAGTELAYETIQNGIPINIFFNAPAMFAERNRIELVGSEDGIDTSDANFQVTGKILKNGAWEEDSNLDISWETKNGGLTVTLPGSMTAARVKLQITYKGVSIEYELYVVSSNPIGSRVNDTTSRNGGVETIYPDTMDTNNLFSVDRLFEIKVDLTAQADQIVYAFVADVENGVAYVDKEAKSIAKFMLSEIRAGTIYVDCGLDEGITLDENKTIVFKTANKFDAANAPGLTFQRMAKRVEFTYALYDDPNGLVITNSALTISDPSLSWVDNSATAIVSCNKTESSVEYKLKRALDITAGNAFDSLPDGIIEIPNGMIIPEIETTWLNHYRLVDLAKLSHPSTGLALSNATIGGGVGFTIEVVSTPRTIKIGNQTYNTVFQKNGKDYLTFTPITDTENQTKVYDYYLFGEGCSNAGDYVLVKINYTSKGVTQNYYMIVKLVPGYNVTIDGRSVAVAGETTSGAVGNSASPYNFVPGKNKTIEFSDKSSSILSVVRERWNTANIANALTYVMKLGGAGQDINVDMKKLGYEDKVDWTLPKEDGKFVLTSQPVIFGEKKYKVDIEDAYGYKIEFFFNLIPEMANTPVIDSSSVTSMIEGQPFDIGVVYESVVMKGDEGNELPITNREQKPSDTTVNVINLRNINTWGVADDNSTDAKTALENAHSGNVIPTFANVNIQRIDFIYNNNSVTTNSVNGGNDLRLATDANFFYPNALKEDKYDYIKGRGVESTLKVPTMPGWIYGTNSSVSVDVVINLGFKDDNNEETCVRRHTIQLTRKASFSEEKSVVVDSVGFNPYEYVKVTNRNDASSAAKDSVLYHDTLEVYLPANNGDVNFDVEFYRGEAKIATANRHPNNSLSRVVTEYYSLSALFEESLPSEVENRNFAGVSFRIVVRANSETACRFRYAGVEVSNNEEKNIAEFKKAKEEDGKKIDADLDTLYIEDAGLISTGVDYIPRTRYYLISVTENKETYTYRYTHEFDLARRWTTLEDGLGQATAKEVYKKSWTNGDVGSFEVSLEEWAENVKVKTHDDIGQGAMFLKDLVNEDLKKDLIKTLRFEVGDKDSTAKFKEDGKTLITGSNYTIGAQEYILINIYVKASGGPFAGSEAWKASNSNSDKLIGQFRIFLTGSEAPSTGA